MIADLALYIHWPFCASLCPYCDFNRGLWSNAPTQDPKIWLRAYQTELSYWRQRLGDRKIKSIFFGGGTPSLMPLSVLEGVLSSIEKEFNINISTIEVTLEMNPTSFEAETLAEILALGVNRISVGVQSLRTITLQLLGRSHSEQEAIKVLSWLKERSITFSFDLIYAHIHHNPLELWIEELTEALKFSGTHVSLYQLTLEPGTPFFREAKKGKKLILDTELAADIYLWTQQYMKSLGWEPYEVSNYTHSNAYCQHNLAYWRYKDYLGIGTGAHSRITLPSGEKYAISNHPTSKGWLQQVLEKKHGIHRECILDQHTQWKERLLMGLRLSEGVEVEKHSPENFWYKIQQLLDVGYVVQEGSRVHLTLEGRLRMDGILELLCGG